MAKKLSHRASSYASSTLPSKQAALDAGKRTDGVTTEEREELCRLRREVRQLAGRGIPIGRRRVGQLMRTSANRAI